MTILLPVTKLMAHLPLALVNDPHDILVICFGMGTTARSASRHEGIQVHVVELVGAVLRCFDCFHADAHEVLAQSNVHTAVDDGRNYLLMHPQEYDVITIDPPPPLHSAGAVNLYTREFFQLCRDRLRPGGVLAMWIPPDSLSEVKMITRSFLDVFEHVNGWAGPPPLSGILLLGSGRPLQHVREKVRQMYELPAVAADLREWGPELDHPEKVLQLYLADKRELSRFVAGVPLITDDSPYTEFPLWRARQAGGEYSRQFSAAAYQRYLIGNGVATSPPE
jgi:spermidine synthase